ncbi:MAG: hypothetical protein EBZ13_03695, partial [Planctomycetia bacterium]|nr:hypothetical protein [Planctomycetia bacterium]
MANLANHQRLFDLPDGRLFRCFQTSVEPGVGPDERKQSLPAGEAFTNHGSGKQWRKVEGDQVTASGALVDTVAIFDDLAPRPGDVGRPFVPAVAGRPGMSLADWLLPPAKGARCVVLTGLPTQFGGGLGKSAERPGDDLFQTAMD